MDELTVRNVDVLGDTIVAGQDKKGQIWAGVSFFCKALGMTNKQRDNQVAKVQSDKTLCKGTLKFQEGYLTRTMRRLHLDWILFLCGLQR